MADYFNATTDFEPELPQYAQDIVEAAEEQKQLKQQEAAEQAVAMEEAVAAGEKSGPPSPEYDQGEPQENIEATAETEQQESSGYVGDGNKSFGDYLSSGGAMGGNPLETFQDLALPGQGVLDTTLDIAKSLLPWLKDADDWWEEASGKATQSPEDKFVRDASAIIIPSLLGGGAISAGLTSGATRLGFTGLTKGGINALGRVGVDAAVGTGIEALSDQTLEAGNLSDLLNSTLGIQTPWVTQEGDQPDVIYKKNMYESAALGGVVGMLDVALSSNLFGRLGKQVLKVIPKDAKAAKKLEKSSLAPKVSFKKSKPASTEPSAMDKVAIDDARREKAQTDEAIARYNADPEGQRGYDPFVNEPHEPQARAVPGYNADPIKFKTDNALIQNNVGTVNGRPIDAVTPGFRKAFATAADGSDRSKLLEQVAEGIEPKFDVMVGEQRLSAKQVDEAIDNLVTAAFTEPANFKNQFSELVTASDSVLGNKTKSLTEDGFIAATGTFKQLLDTLGPTQQKASAVIVSQAAGNVSDASRAVSLIGDTMDTTRQQQLAFDALRVMMPEIRLNQLLSGKRLQMKNIAKGGDKKQLKKFIEEQSADIDNKIKSTKKEVEEFLDTALEVSRKNPEYFKPLLREFVKSNGEIDTIYKLSKHMENKISFWKKAFYDGNPEVPSLLVQQLRALRYNNILTGLAPVRAAAGAFTGLIGKPVTTFVGTAATGDMASFKRATFVYGGIRENLGRAFTALADEWKFAVEAPQLSATRTRKDFSDVMLADFESMEEMAAAWEAQGQLGKVAAWNMTKGLSIFNNNPIVRSGINAMTAIDGFTKSMSASMSARSRAYDELFDEANGAIDIEAYSTLQKKLYDQSFDKEGLLTDSAAIYASGELNLNLDSKTVSTLETFMARVPVAKSIFMFPRTGINAVKLLTTFSPTGVLGVSVGKGRAVKNAVTQAEIDDVLVTHGYKPGDNAAFKQLKSEYIGRELMGGAVVMGAALYALDGGLRGSGPADPAERKRMLDMKWQPYTFRDWNGEWKSYQGLEPFDTFLGLTADIVYEGQRMDSAITDEWFQALVHSITMNITNKTFLSGFEPLARMLSQDPSAMSRFLAMQTDAHIPGTGVRSILNKAIAPQLKDVENNFQSYLANRFKGLPGVNSNLYDLVDIYTGKPINYTEPLTAAVNALLPFGKTNGGNEEWRQKLLASGWDGLQTVRTHPVSKQPMTPEQRNWVNNWIGKNWGMDKKMEEFFEQGDEWAERQLKSYVKDRGLQKQSEFPIKQHIVHRELDRIHDAAFDAAFAAMQQQDASLYNQGVLQKAVEDMLNQGNTTSASNTANQLRNLINASK